MKNWIRQIKKVLKESDDLRNIKWQGSSNYLAGHCYVASEVIYYLLGGKKNGWTPYTYKRYNIVHWWIQDKSGQIIDITAKQFNKPIPYHKGRGRGFLTKRLSKRAKQLLQRIKNA